MWLTQCGKSLGQCHGDLGIEIARGTDLSARRHGTVGSAYRRASGRPGAEYIRRCWRVAPDAGCRRPWRSGPGSGGRRRAGLTSSTGIDLGACAGGSVEAGFRLTREW